MGQVNEKEESGGYTSSVAGKRKRLLEAPFDSEEEELEFNTPFSEWRKNETLEQLQARRRYYSREIMYFDQIPNWSKIGWKKPEDLKQQVPVNHKFNNMLCLSAGSLTQIDGIDAVVNAANSMFLGGGGIDGAIHNQAGDLLVRECAKHNGLPTGTAVITKGYNMPAKFIVHTCGPTDEDPQLLENCYTSVLNAIAEFNQQNPENKIKSVGFCCISTGVYGYPIGRATCKALSTTRKWLEDNENNNFFGLEKILFVVFTKEEEKYYNQVMPVFFPVCNEDAEAPNKFPEDPMQEYKRIKKQKLKEMKARRKQMMSEYSR